MHKTEKVYDKTCDSYQAIRHRSSGVRQRTRERDWNLDVNAVDQVHSLDCVQLCAFVDDTANQEQLGAHLSVKNVASNCRAQHGAQWDNMPCGRKPERWQHTKAKPMP